jgi:hypothetical protein
MTLEQAKKFHGGQIGRMARTAASYYCEAFNRIYESIGRRQKRPSNSAADAH